MKGIFRRYPPEEILLKLMNDVNIIHLLFYNNLHINIILIIISYFTNYYERRVYIKKYVQTKCKNVQLHRVKCHILISKVFDRPICPLLKINETSENMVHLYPDFIDNIHIQIDLQKLFDVY